MLPLTTYIQVEVEVSSSKIRPLLDAILSVDPDHGFAYAGQYIEPDPMNIKAPKQTVQAGWSVNGQLILVAIGDPENTRDILPGCIYLGSIKLVSEVPIVMSTLGNNVEWSAAGVVKDYAKRLSQALANTDKPAAAMTESERDTFQEA